MNFRSSLKLAAAVSFAACMPFSAMAQNASMRASIVGGNDGRCTFEVEIDGVAEVEIRGDQGYLRTISGSRATWRRLECTQPLPRRSNDFRFKGIDGRGRQDLMRDPNSNGGTAVIRLEDPKNGREGYTGQITWNGGSGGNWGGSGGSGGNWGGSGGSGGGNWGGSGGSWNGWDNSWGSNINYNGYGNGNFDRSGGPQYSLRGVRVNVNRNNGRVQADFNTNQGSNTLQFVGNVTRISSRTVEANITSAKNRGQGGSVSGTMRLRVESNGTVRSIDMDGDINGGRFNLNWNN